MDLKLLIYSKCFDNELTYKLLHIADSKTVLEDLIDLIDEIYRFADKEDCIYSNRCKMIYDMNTEMENVKNSLDEAIDKLTDLSDSLE